MNQRAPLFLLLLSFFVYSCGTENEPTYTLSTSVSPDGRGTISPSAGEFTEGEQITLTGIPSEGWVLSRWEGDWSSSNNPTTITMDRDKVVVGVFERRDYPLNITIEGEGTVTETIVSQPTTDYSYETIVELTPNPSEGWRFVEWGGDLSGSESPQQITIDGEKNVVVKFQRRDYPLNITIEGEGTVTETIISQPTTDYTYETIVELTPNPSEGWEFVDWGGDLSGSESPQQITIDGEKNVVVKFENLFYLGENGVTVMCPETEVGDKGTINVIEYESVDRELLIQRRDEGSDLTKVCVSNVTDMSSMFTGSPFNQPIGNWDVSNVTNMSGMFTGSTFNQPIGDWDVSNITDMSEMFSESQFNQPIGNWDVSYVINMSGMFTGSTFNQPIGDWDVSNITDMSEMFSESQFNQYIGGWCVTQFPSEPTSFSTGSPLTQQNKPIWGTCPLGGLCEFEIKGTYRVTTTETNPGGCSGVTNIVDVEIIGAGIFRISDLTGGVYKNCYGALDNPGIIIGQCNAGNGLQIIDQDDVVFGGDVFNGTGLIFDDGSFRTVWQNNFGDQGVSIHTKN